MSNVTRIPTVAETRLKAIALKIDEVANDDTAPTSLQLIKAPTRQALIEYFNAIPSFLRESQKHGIPIEGMEYQTLVGHWRCYQKVARLLQIRDSITCQGDLAYG